MEGITVTPQIYAVTIVCPLCQQPMSFDANSVNVCPHCGRHFIVKPAVIPQAPTWAGGPPMEVKNES